MACKNHIITFLLFLSSCAPQIDTSNLSFKEYKSQQWASLIDESYRSHAIIFFSLDCPMSKRMIGTINQLVDSVNGKPVEIILLLEKIKENDQKIIESNFKPNSQLKIGIDPNWKIAKKLKAKVTPECILLDSNGNAHYSGLINDYYISLKSHNDKITHQYLYESIFAMLNGQSYRPNQTEAFGCKIE